MNRIILPTPEPSSPLAPFGVLGFFQSGNLSLQLNLIESIVLSAENEITVTMHSGHCHLLSADAGKIFLADANEFVKRLLQQMQQPQIVGVPPGTQIRTH